MIDHANLFCVGNITIDESIQADGTTTVALGGDAIFATLAALHSGHPATWFAPIGNDLPDGFASQLARLGTPMAAQPRRKLPTVRNSITYYGDGTRKWRMHCIERDFDIMSVHPGDITDDLLGARGILVLAMSLHSQLELVPQLRHDSDATLYVDLQEDYIDGNEEQLLAMLGQAHVALPSESEALRVTGCSDPIDAARRIAAAGAQCVVITMAERGCVVLDGGIATHVPTEVVTPVDSTGAGDAFCGAFAATHLHTGDALAAARAGAAAARLTVLGPGVTALYDAVIGPRDAPGKQPRGHSR